MVDVTQKAPTTRTALAAGRIRMAPATLQRIREGSVAKGDVLAVAQVAGIMAAKRTFETIPMCHPLLLTGVNIRFEYLSDGVGICAEVKCRGETGVEMEALHAVSAAALTIYDMCKAVDKGMEMNGIHLCQKSGGKSGIYIRKAKQEV